MTTHYARGSHVGIDLEATPDAAEHALGYRVEGNDSTVWVYVQASGVIDQYAFVAIDEDFQAAELTTALAEVGHRVGVAQVAFADNDYGFVAVEGSNLQGIVSLSCAADISLWTTATGGEVDDSSTFGGLLLDGVVAIAANSLTSVAAAVEVMLMNPHVVGF